MRARAEVIDAPAVEFVAVEDDEHTYQFRLVAGEHDVGTIRVIVNDRVIGVAIGVRSRAAFDDAFAQRLIDELEHLAAAHPGLPMRVAVGDALVRHRLHAAGWTGGLRAPLRNDEPGPAAEDEVDELRRLLPHLDVVAERATRRALRLVVSARDCDARVEVGMARRGMLVEQVAASLDTAVAVKRAFAPLVDSVARLHLRTSDYAEPPTKRASGRALGAEHVLIDTSMVYVDELLTDRRGVWELQRGAPDQMMFHPDSTPTDGVTAHELWHLFGDQLIGDDEDRLAFDRALGEVLGVDVIHDAIRPLSTDEPLEWSDSMVKLAQEVSLYATTSYREATAEMFRVWWCSPGDHSPVVARFGELVEERLGRPAHPTKTDASV